MSINVQGPDDVVAAAQAIIGMVHLQRSDRPLFTIPDSVSFSSGFDVRNIFSRTLRFSLYVNLIS